MPSQLLVICRVPFTREGLRKLHDKADLTLFDSRLSLLYTLLHTSLYSSSHRQYTHTPTYPPHSQEHAFGQSRLLKHLLVKSET